MNILFLGYWGSNEGLSQSTTSPHLKILASFSQVKHIYYVSIERSKQTAYNIPKNTKITHLPFSSNQNTRFLSKVHDFIRLPQYLKKIIRLNSIDLLLCRSALAGSIGQIMHKITTVPYAVESFEPHADYMRELNVWNKYGISYLIQKYFEYLQKRNAIALMTVSKKYTELLYNNGVLNSKLATMPCAVESKKFAFSGPDRKLIRKNLGISDSSIVGIYVGKFGDIYFDHEAFHIFKSAFDHFNDFRLIILTPHNDKFIKKRLDQHKIDPKKVFSSLVAHQNVPAYLSSADFAFSTVRPTPYRKYCCPIKNGEYWASGLPIVTFPDIGDDSEIIVKETKGIIIEDLEKINWSELTQLLQNQDSRSEIAELAKLYRSFSSNVKVYRWLFDLIIDKRTEENRQVQ